MSAGLPRVTPQAKPAQKSSGTPGTGRNKFRLGHVLQGANTTPRRAIRACRRDRSSPRPVQHKLPGGHHAYTHHRARYHGHHAHDHGVAGHGGHAHAENSVLRVPRRRQSRAQTKTDGTLREILVVTGVVFLGFQGLAFALHGTILVIVLVGGDTVTEDDLRMLLVELPAYITALFGIVLLGSLIVSAANARALRPLRYSLRLQRHQERIDKRRRALARQPPPARIRDAALLADMPHPRRVSPFDRLSTSSFRFPRLPGSHQIARDTKVDAARPTAIA